MDVIADHEFIANQRGELVLLVNMLSEKPPHQPVFLVSSTQDAGYLRRDSGSDDFYQIVGINPNVINQLRSLDMFLIVEMSGENTVHTYPVAAGIVDEDEDDGEDEGNEEP